MDLFINALLGNIPGFGIVVVAVIVLIISNRRLEQQLSKFEQRIERLEEKIEQMTLDFISKEQHYQDVSGWRGELRKLEDRIERLTDKLLEVVKCMEVRK